MAKKYNPQQTRENIITVSTNLFVQKGYDKTSMQDIVDALFGDVKGRDLSSFQVEGRDF